MLTLRPHHRLVTMTGRVLDPDNPSVGAVHAADIAHHLSQICRWGGACREFYSVAQHSVLVASAVRKQAHLAALLHDAAEAYLGDVAAPLKRRAGWDEYRRMEGRLNLVLETVFGFAFDDHADEVALADLQVCAAEARDLMPHGAECGIPEGIVPYDDLVVPWPPDVARSMWTQAFKAARGLQKT